MTTARQIKPDEWQLGRFVRLSALHDSPAAFSETYADAVAQPDDFWQGRAERGARGETSFSAIAFSGDDPIGMAVGIADQQDSSLGYLAAMWVAPEHRGTAAAPLLVNSVTSWAIAHGMKTLFAGVLKENHRAAAFYQKVGFTQHNGPAPNHPAADGSELLLCQELE